MTTDIEHFEKMLLARAIKYPNQRSRLKLDPEHITDKRNRAIYTDILKDQNITEDTILTNAIKHSRKYGGFDHVKSILDYDTVTEKGILTDQSNIFNYYKREKIAELSRYYLEHPSEDMANELKETMNQLDRFSLGEKDTKKETLSEIMDELFQPVENTIIKTNIKKLDDIIDGLEMQQLNVVAARPSMGKTAFAIELAKGLNESGCNSVICSLETHEKSLTRRLLSNISRVDLHKFKDPYERMTTDEIQQVLEAINVYHDLPTRIKVESKFTPNNIRQIARTADPKQKTFVIIDYLQLMKTDGRPNTRFDEVSEISRELKMIAQEYPHISIIALSQLSRAVESRNDKRPMMSDLRESGQLEQDANIVMMLYRDDYYNPPEDINPKSASPLEVIVAKNKDGMVGTAELDFYKNIQKIY